MIDEQQIVKEFARKTSKPDPRITPAFAWRE
jgi:hypothetical protein